MCNLHVRPRLQRSNKPPPQVLMPKAAKMHNSGEKPSTGFDARRQSDGLATHLPLCHCNPGPWYGTRLRRWSFFHNDGMVMFFFQGTIAIDGFSMVLPSLDHHH